MQTQLVPLSLDNIAELAPLYCSVFNSPPWNDGWTEAAAIERLESFAKYPRFHGLALFKDGAPAALVLGWGERWVHGWVFHIKELCVRTETQNQGIGHRLMLSFEEALSTESFQSVYLQTGENAPARSFYSKLGYEKFGIVSLRKRLQKEFT